MLEIVAIVGSYCHNCEKKNYWNDTSSFLFVII